MSSTSNSPARATPPPTSQNLSAQTSPQLSQTQQTSRHGHSHSHLSGLSNSTGAGGGSTNQSNNSRPHTSNSDQQARYRASVEYNNNNNNNNGSSSARNWSSASIRPTGNPRPASELLQGSVSVGANSTNGNGGGSSSSNFASPESKFLLSFIFRRFFLLSMLVTNSSNLESRERIYTDLTCLLL